MKNEQRNWVVTFPKKASWVSEEGVGGECGKMDEGDQKAQNSSYKRNQLWECI